MCIWFIGAVLSPDAWGMGICIGAADEGCAGIFIVMPGIDIGSGVARGTAETVALG